MSQETANTIRTKFKCLTGIDISAKFMQNGENHKPTALPKNKCGVYVFMNEHGVFKVGKAGKNSQARWNSHHYNLDDTTPSTFPKSIMKNKEKFKEYYPLEKHSEIDNLASEHCKDWIQKNVSRIEFTMEAPCNEFALGLLEALAQYHLKPIFEG